MKDASAPTSTPESTTTATDPASPPQGQGKDPAGGTPPKPEATPAGAPEKYEFKAPEGYTLSEAIITEATPIFKELNLTQDQAQKLVDFHSKQMLKAAEAPQEAYRNLRADWQNQLKTDPVIGNQLDVVKTNIGRVISALPVEMQQPFKDAMDLTGAGDHPAFVKAMNKFHELIGEGKLVQGGNPSPLGQSAPGARKSAAQAMYPNLPSANAS